MDRKNQILLTSQSPGEITSEHPLVTDGLKTKESKKKKRRRKKEKTLQLSLPQAFQLK
jgi:hypothetical protein